MTSAEGVLIADARAFLRRAVTTQLSAANPSDLLTAFCGWAGLIPESSDLENLSNRTSSHTGAQRGYRDVAVLGFINASRALPTKEAEALWNLLDWVSQCSIEVDGTPVGISTDALAMLGIALAATAATPLLQSKVSLWINKASSAAPGLDAWKRGIMAVARRIASSKT